jgi:alkaline phosphatase D
MRRKRYRNLLGSVPVMGIWDDHDYGHNDAGWDLPVKNLTRKAFLDFIEEGQVCGGDKNQHN